MKKSINVLLFLTLGGLILAKFLRLKFNYVYDKNNLVELIQEKKTNQKNNFEIKVELKVDNFIKTKNTCQGKNQLPNIKFLNIPENTQKLALIIDDPDAPKVTVNHFLAYNIPVEVDFLDKNSDFNKFKLLKNSYQNLGYNGPCPPIGETHRYFFKLYALNKPIIEKIETKEELERAIQQKVITKTETIAFYKKIDR